MMDITARKTLFNDYAQCHYIKVDVKGKILRDAAIDVEYVSIDKKGNVFVDWYPENKYEHSLKSAEVNVVHQAMYNREIEGVFTSQEEALAVAAEWFNKEKKEKIAELEAELTELKKQSV